MKIKRIVWLTSIVEKLGKKHSVEQIEILEIFHGKPKIRFVEKGLHENEHVYSALGKTYSGRCLIVFFILKSDGQAIIISGRDMSSAERRRYEKK